MSVLAVVVAIAIGTYLAFSTKNISASESFNAVADIPEEIVQQNQKAANEAEIYLAGGCFWGTEFLMRNVPGVTSVEVGYSNGLTRNPTYHDVCNDSGHAESAHVIYDPNGISLVKLLDIYYQSIDPTFVNHQGKDQGIQYRTGIYFSDPADEEVIKTSLNKLQGNFFNPVVVECKPIKNFYRAEEEHQEYLYKNPNGYCHVSRSLIDEQAKENAAKEFPNKDFSRGRTYDKPDKKALEKLSDLQRAVTQNGETEPPYKNEYNEENREGIYVDVTNGQPLFVSTDKFDSGCGWPAFAKPIEKGILVERKDFSFGMDRVEVRAKASGAHLGHVFDDGKKENGGMRYCINSASLRFISRDKMPEEGYGDWLDLFKH
ncbi:MAG: peptide-methionine (R)-S-oxide reductase MsrB [Selenomonadaceae bacterium]|nr:peptide-methionine (R)-S-oxide reductase MsrB [Selenomonadaceae bacterium]